MAMTSTWSSIMMHYAALALFYLIVFPWGQTFGQQNGHYRCHWYPGPAQGPVVGGAGDQKADTENSSQCDQADSATLKSLVTQCTGQNFQHPAICQSNGTWDCHSFFGVCKTLIRTEDTPRPPTADTRESMVDSCRRLLGTDTVGQTNVAPAGGVPYPGNNDCPPDANYFTLKDLSLAVLVSFITGATMLAIVIFVVWKCRNTKWEMEQRKLALLQKVQSLAALQHIMTVSSGSGSRHEVESGHIVSNPSYAQVIASTTLLEEMLGDQDKMYEEITTGYRDTSLKKREENLYSKVDKSNKKDKGKGKDTSGKKQRVDVDIEVDNDSIVDGNEIANAMSSVTDSGILDDDYDDVRSSKDSDRPVFTIDVES